ncbi:RluA family pseudouridine synthase [Corallococcus sp. H22C18031201]|uniref:RluA family pseudouridine synthase n=1 Tax=Citreicoccus inhibens TaxID=2849499 RepID=UPI000E7193B2|nr:RluA family pseudouridine synthase [Citreicoccus inhibens]MBU8899595.1 RluA family pseudouridine synthase [Citreicoccus inhibens]RJS27422.1 RluA family pseudouridine synthase [Corallococcus sp. H22C18031201]
MALRKVLVPREIAGDRLDRFLTKHVPGLTPERARALLDSGRVRIRGKKAQATRKLWGGEELEIETLEPRLSPHLSSEGPPLPVLYDDAALVVVDKPPGLVVEPEGRAPSVVGLLAARCPPFDVEGLAQPGVVHRLDRETSGCLALTRTDLATAALLQAFQAKRVDKRYQTLVLGRPPDTGRLEGPYARDPKDPRRFTTRVPSARRAALTFSVRERFAEGALLDIDLDTGRTHQIRVQLSEAGFPVLGDSLYGSEAARQHPAALAVGRQALHAWRLEVPSSATGKVVHVESALPEDFLRGLALLRG